MKLQDAVERPEQKQQQNPSRIDEWRRNRPALSVDWAKNESIFTDNGCDYHGVDNCVKILHYLRGREPHLITIESTHHSKSREQRQEFIRRCFRSPHLLVHLNPKVTKIYRQKFFEEGDPEIPPHPDNPDRAKKTNRVDCHVIHRITRDTDVLLSNPVILPVDDRVRRDAIRDAAAKIEADPNIDSWLQTLISRLDRPNLRDRGRAQPFLKDGGYKDIIYLIPACLFAEDRDEFDALIGRHQNGKPSKIRNACCTQLAKYRAWQDCLDPKNKHRFWEESKSKYKNEAAWFSRWLRKQIERLEENGDQQIQNVFRSIGRYMPS